MSLLAQQWLVGVIVGVCALFSAWRLLSPRQRLRLLDTLAPLAGWVGAGAVLARLRGRLAERIEAGCTGCSQHNTRVHRPGARGGATGN
jgi:hypothetical protein